MSSITNQIIRKLHQGRNVFTTGGAGVGKSHMAREVIKAFDNVVVLAPTGLAAANIGGQTIHSFFRLPLDRNAPLNELYFKQKDLIRLTRLIVIDEVSMMSKHVFDWIRERMIEAASSATFLLIGDFYQLSPVPVPGEEPEYAFESSYWDELRLFTVGLNVIKRTKDREFMSVLGQLRKAEVSPEGRRMLRNMKETEFDPNLLTKLYTTNQKVDEINLKSLNALPGETSTFHLKEELIIPSEDKYFKRFIENLPISHTLHLKPGAQVILTFNNKDAGIYNGLKTVIKEIRDDSILTTEGHVIIPMVYECIKYIANTDYRQGTSCIVGKRVGNVYQYPIKLAYALTVHKSQGMSIDGLEMDLSKIFAPGQAYVAISRAIDPNHTVVKLPSHRTVEDLFFHDAKVHKFYEEINYDIEEEVENSDTEVAVDMEILKEIQIKAKQCGISINTYLEKMLQQGA